MAAEQWMRPWPAACRMVPEAAKRRLPKVWQCESCKAPQEFANLAEPPASGHVLDVVAKAVSGLGVEANYTPSVSSHSYPSSMHGAKGGVGGITADPVSSLFKGAGISGRYETHLAAPSAEAAARRRSNSRST